ncbi:MAG: hypothetical protein CSYNP_03946 [Syntrophus sp. SKADARSKE-3]|nr:hypothetical protein [Syntrophus sp. SKADARSKE-3]
MSEIVTLLFPSVIKHLYFRDLAMGATLIPSSS